MAIKVPRAQGEVFFSIPEVAKRKDVSRVAVYMAVKRGDLPAFRRGKRWFVLERDLARYIPRRKVSPAA